MQSPYGPQMAYALAKDAWHEQGQGILAHFESLAVDPIAQAREFGRMEEAFRSADRARRSAPNIPQRRATSAPPPMRPV
jgi:hypothetical protein